MTLAEIGSSISSSMRSICWPRATTRVLDVVGRPASVRTKSELRCRSSSSVRSEEHTSELQSLAYLVCRLLLEKKKTKCAAVPHMVRAKGPKQSDECHANRQPRVYIGQTPSALRTNDPTALRARADREVRSAL